MHSTYQQFLQTTPTQGECCKEIERFMEVEKEVREKQWFLFFLSCLFSFFSAFISFNSSSSSSTTTSTTSSITSPTICSFLPSPSSSSSSSSSSSFPSSSSSSSFSSISSSSTSSQLSDIPRVFLVGPLHISSAPVLDSLTALAVAWKLKFTGYLHSQAQVKLRCLLPTTL